jgi:hypothetical protein
MVQTERMSSGDAMGREVTGWLRRRPRGESAWETAVRFRRRTEM